MTIFISMRFFYFLSVLLVICSLAATDVLARRLGIEIVVTFSFDPNDSSSDAAKGVQVCLTFEDHCVTTDENGHAYTYVESGNYHITAYWEGTVFGFLQLQRPDGLVCWFRPNSMKGDIDLSLVASNNDPQSRYDYLIAIRMAASSSDKQADNCPIEPLEPTSPLIASIKAPRAIVMNVETSIEIGFLDDDGDIIAVRLEYLQGQRTQLVREFDPYIRNQKKGTIKVLLTCSQIGVQQWRVTLVDSEGLTDWDTFRFECTPPIRLSEMPIRTNSSIFIVDGQGIMSIRVQVYDLMGKLIYHKETNGNRVGFSDALGLPNGTYVYFAIVKDASGTAIRTILSKLVIAR